MAISLPKFSWPIQTEEPNLDAVATTVKNIVNSAMNETQMNIDSSTTPNAIITDSPITIMQAAVENNSTDQIPTTTENILTTVTNAITNKASSIITTISNKIESVTPSIATANSFNTESTESNRTELVTNINSTVFTEFGGSGSTMEENSSTIDTMLENTTTEANFVAETTEKMVNITNNAIDWMTSNQTDTNQAPENMYHDDNSVTVYVILGLLLGVLILIFIALLIIYRKYKKCRQGSGDYCVAQLKEINSSSSIKTISDLEDVHVKH